MTLKRFAVLAVMLLLSAMTMIANTNMTVEAQDGSDPVEFWAVLVCGGPEIGFRKDTDYMYYVLTEDYAFDDIYYLNVNTSIPGVDAPTRKNNTRWAINTWLAGKSDSNDVVFIFINSHGGGYWTFCDPPGNTGGRLDANGDEGSEVGGLGYDEAMYMENTTNGGGCMRPPDNQTQSGPYWDDELAYDLQAVDCSTLILVRCGCFGGGLIDDLSTEEKQRIIMTSTSEDQIAYFDIDGDGYSEWPEAFLNGLHGRKTHWDNYEIIEDETLPSYDDADYDDDGRISMWEAYYYARTHDTAHMEPHNPHLIHGREFPWLDDNGNKLPNFIYDRCWDDSTDGNLSKTTFFPHRLLVKTRKTNNDEILNVDVQINDVQYTSPVPANLSEGNHTVNVPEVFYTPGIYKYTFDHWDWQNSTSSNVTIPVLENMQVTAYYSEEYLGSGGGCPYVSTWDGTQYVPDNNLIPAAEYSNGNDVVDHYKLRQPLAIFKGGYSSLVWDLDKHSFLDQVQLMAIDHESDTNIAVSPCGQILTFRDPTPPTTAVDNYGNQILDLLKAQDGQYHEGYAGDCIQLDFSGTDIQNGAKLVITSDWCRNPPCAIVKSPVYIQIQNPHETWLTVATIYPRIYWATDIIDMSEYLPDADGELRIRIVYTGQDRIDYIGLDTSKQGEFEARYATLVTATHSTRGDIKDVLMHSDNTYAELLPGEEIALKFTVPRSKEHVRDFIIVVEGHYFTFPA